MGQNASLSSNPNLPAYLVLSSELKAFVEDAGYYFKNSSAAINIALDNLLLTQRWHRFTWSQIQGAETYKPVFKRKDGLHSKGMALNKEGQPLRKAIIYLLDLKSGKTDLVSANEEGHFLVTQPGKASESQYLFQVWQQGVFQKQAQLKFGSDSDALPEISQGLSVAFTDTLVSAKLVMQTKITKQYTLADKKSESVVSDTAAWMRIPADRNYQLQQVQWFS